MWQAEGTVSTPLLAAYVLHGKYPVGVVDRGTILDSIIVHGLDPAITSISDIMKPPVVFKDTTLIAEVLNAIIDGGLREVVCQWKVGPRKNSTMRS